APSAAQPPPTTCLHRRRPTAPRRPQAAATRTSNRRAGPPYRPRSLRALGKRALQSFAATIEGHDGGVDHLAHRDKAVDLPFEADILDRDTRIAQQLCVLRALVA